MTIQFYWKGWYRRPWHTKLYDGICGWQDIYSHYAGIGPLQVHWYSTK